MRSTQPRRVPALLQQMMRLLLLACMGLGCSLSSGPSEEMEGDDGTGRLTNTAVAGNSGTDTAKVMVAPTLVNNPPDAVDDTRTVYEDSTATVVNVLTNDTVAPVTGGTLTVTAVTQPTWGGTVALAGGAVSFTPAPNFNGTTTFTYTVTDSSGGTDTATVMVAVTPVNDPPAAGDDSVTVAEDSGATVVDVRANDSSAPDTGETLAVAAVIQPASGGSVNLSGGAVRFTPAANFNGTTTFFYILTDFNGGTDSASVTVTVTPVNDPPTVVNDAVTVAENSSNNVVDVLANDSTAPDTGETLTVTAVTQPTWGGAVALGGGWVSFTPTPNFNGTTMFTYTVSDGSGGSNTASVTVTVTGTNDPPTANDDALTVLEDSGATVMDVLANDSSAPDTGETLTVAAVTQPASGGSVTLSGGVVSFTPAANFNGTTTFTYDVSDGNGGTAAATVTVTATPVNDVPTAVDDALMVEEDSGTTVVRVLDNDTAAPDTGETLTVMAVTQPASGGAVTLTSGEVHFTPAASFNGTTTFTYTVSDGNGGTDSGTVTVTVTAQPPAAPVVLTPANGSSTQDTTPTYSGMAEATSTVTVYVDGAPVGMVVASALGNWSFPQVAPLAEGTHAVKATAENAAGNTSPDSNVNTFTVDTIAPGAPVVQRPANGSTTSNSEPTYSGTADTNSTVTIYVDGAPVGTTAANGSGAWSFTQPLPLAGGTHTVRATATDTSGNASAGSNRNTFTVDTDPNTGGWRTTVALATARENHTETVLPSGLVLVTGGEGSIGSLARAELYDPSTEQWSAAGTLETARRGHTATVLLSGKVLITGGEGSSGFPVRAELYDPSTGNWSTIGALETARRGHTATRLLSGEVLVIGGYNLLDGSLASTEVYDPDTEQWRTVGALETARRGHTATLLPSGKVLVIGGQGPGGFLASAELYDPGTETWSPAGVIATPRSLHTATVSPSGEVLVAGGEGHSGFLASTELYDPATEVFRTTGALSTARRNHSATVLPSGRVLVTGGEGATGLLSSTEVYTSSAKGWSPVASLATARTNHQATVLPSGHVLVTGGRGSGGALDKAEVFEALGSSSPTAPLTEARTHFMAVLLPDGQVLVVGGAGSSGPLDSAQLYNPATGEWSDTNPLGEARASATATLLATGKVLAAGGKGGGSQGLQGSGTDTVFGSAELYDPATKSWLPTGPLQTPRHSHSALRLASGKVLVTGGIGENGKPLRSAELYDPATGTWTSAGTMLVARRDHMVAQLPTGSVLIAGGMNEQDKPLFSAEVYEPKSGKWRETASMKTARAESRAALLPTSQVLVAGGTDDGVQVLQSAEIYEPTKEQWIPVAPMSTARKAHAALLLPTGRVLIVGGLSVANTALDGVDLYHPDRGTWEKMSPVITPRADSMTVLLANGKVLVFAGNDSSVPLLSSEEYVEYGVSSVERPKLEVLASQQPKARFTVRGRHMMSPPGGTNRVNLQTVPGGKLIELEATAFSDTSVQVSFPDPDAVPEGIHLLFVLANDIAGGQAVLIDGTPPGAPTLRISGPSTQPGFSGSAEPGSTVRVVLQNREIGTAEADFLGDWSLPQATGLPEGEYTVWATAEDSAGNRSQESAPLTFTVDTQAPLAPEVSPLEAVTRYRKPRLSGRAEAGSTVRVFLNEREAGLALADSQGLWSMTPSSELKDGEYAVTATATDKAGNTGPASAPLTFAVDTEAPAAPTLLSPEEGEVVASHSLVLSGTAEPGSTVRVSVNEEEQEGSAWVDDQGLWRFPLSVSADGMYTASATAVDRAGNRSPASAPRQFTVGIAADMSGGCGGCAGGPGEPSLVLLLLIWLRRPLSRLHLASVRNALLACMWLGCSSPGNLDADGLPAEHRAPITVVFGESLTETRPERMSATSRALTCQGDTAPPALSRASQEIYLECTGSALGNVWVAPDITATDACEGSVPVYRFNTGDDDQDGIRGSNTGDDDQDGIPGSVDPDDFGFGPTTEREGRYQVEYLAWDSHFNLARTRLWVNVLDTLPPVLSLNGAETELVECFQPSPSFPQDQAPYIDPGAVAEDQCDGAVSPNIIVFSMLDKQSPGVYTLEYQVHDGAYNWADPVTRTVEVRDTLPPIVTQRPISPLTPADGTLRSFSLSQCLEVQDQCDDSMVTNLNCRITSISSDEPGADAGDIIINVDAVTFSLRAEASSGGDGREYTVMAQCTDSKGNSASGQCTFEVPAGP
jgi:hypothetical protein